LLIFKTMGGVVAGKGGANRIQNPKPKVIRAPYAVGVGRKGEKTSDEPISLARRGPSDGSEEGEVGKGVPMTQTCLVAAGAPGSLLLVRRARPKSPCLENGCTTVQKSG